MTPFPPIISKTVGFVPICAMEDIGTKDDWAAAQRVLILSRVSKGMGVPTENSEEPNAEIGNTKAEG